ncbi:MAG TPA: hypothetical protein VH309_05270, partial [Elusimicrobiota bacterium]|nr:hypothetical protein [Elusimicrobiota bacterium]
HEDPRSSMPKPAPADARRATLEELWQRRLLPPDQDSWAPQDLELLGKIRAAEKDALAYLRRLPGGTRPWTALPREGGDFSAPKLTKAGYERYVFLLSQDVLAYFESKGAEAKWALKLRDWDGRPLFDGGGLVTDDGVRVYRLARANLPVFWKSPNGDVYGTRRPPAQAPAPAPPQNP